MKKLLFFIILLAGTNFVYASEDTINLDMPEDKIELGSPMQFVKTVDKPDLRTQSPYIQYEDIDDKYKAKKHSFSKEKEFNKMTVGAKYDASVSPEDLKQSRTLYSKYKFNKNMSVKSSYTTDNSDINKQLQGTVSVTPEYRFNKHFAIDNTYSKNIGSKSNKEEISLKVNPFADADRMDIKFGAGQVQYDDGSPSSSQLNFGTNFRF